MALIRTVFQPTEQLEVSEQEERVLRRAGHLFAGTEQELAEHYRAAGLEPPTPGAKTTAQPAPKIPDQAKES